MTEPLDPSTLRSAHPGELIRSAREARGWTLSHLSMLLKLPERRLQAFEEGRWDDVGDRTFVRALAQSLARHLAIDPTPLLQALPASSESAVFKDASAARAASLANSTPLAGGATRRSGPVLAAPSGVFGLFKRPSVLLGMLILAAAAALAWAPSSWWTSPEPPSAPQPAAGAAPEPAPPPASVTTEVLPSPGATPASEPILPAAVQAPNEPAIVRQDTAPARAAPSVAAPPVPAPAPVVAPSTAPPPTAAPSSRGAAASAPVTSARETATEPSGAWGAGTTTMVNSPCDFVGTPTAVRSMPPELGQHTDEMNRTVDEPALRLTINQTSWVQVTDAQGQVLVSRLIPAGEKVELVGARPLNLRVGNAAGVQVQWRGQAIDLQAHQRSNVAQMDLP